MDGCLYTGRGSGAVRVNPTLGLRDEGKYLLPPSS